MTGSASRVVVLGIGNLLWADEGFGVRCVEALQRGYVFEPEIRLVDGGTQGLYLLDLVQDADRLLILDAIDYGLTPGTLRVIEGDDVPRFLGAKKMSLHQTGFQEVLALAQLTGRYPSEVVLIGCQPEELEDYGGSLRPVVKQALQAAVDEALLVLRRWQVASRPRQGADDRDDPLALDIYERGRPSADEACRIGDARVIAQSPREGE